MFVLLTVKDTIPVAPKAFGIAPAVTITDAINKKYANKLIQDKGLALSCFDILTAEDGKVTWGNGLMYYKVTFRLLLFAPFVGEVINARVMYSTPRYVRISIDFFKDIYITPASLPPNSIYDPAEKRFFYWAESASQLEASELFSTVKASRLYIDDGEPFKFRVESLDWQDIKPEPPNVDPPGPKAVPNGAANGVPNGHAKEEEEGMNGDIAEAEKGKDPFDLAGWKIFGNIGESGLGVISWWGGGGGEEEEEEAMMQE